MDDLQKQDKIAFGSIADVVETPVAIAVRRERRNRTSVQPTH
jgi:hypothetical protein